MYTVEVLAHYFFPRHTNNHKAKLLHSSTLLLLSILLVFYQLMLQIFPLTGVKVLGYAANIPVDEVVRLINQERAEVGAPPLQVSPLLAQAAKSKGEHMLSLDYWAHVAPDGTEPWKFFTDVGYKYRYAGENLARDFSNPSSAVEAWMASPSHKENLLSGKYKETGVAVIEGDLGEVETTIIVQFFGTQLVDTAPQIPIAEAKPELEIQESPTVSPSPTPVLPPAIALISPEPTTVLVAAPPGVQEKAGGLKILVSPFATTRGISIVTTLLLLIVMAIDGIVVARRRITRVGGRTFAHLAFLGMILAIVLIAKAGEIL